MAFFRRRRRKRLRGQPFPAGWLRILEENVPLYRRLPADDRRELQGHMQVLLAEKHFEGCAGLALTDEIRVTIAAQACLLLLHRPTDYYPRLVSILVYPHAYIVAEREADELGVVTEEFDIRLGESWRQGAVVLSWADVLAGAADAHDGYNVVLHEFAHQLDAEEDGQADGVVALPHRSWYADWARVLGREYERLQRDVDRGRRTVLDPYGAENPAEFFAVATECFFEQPARLRDRHPGLYAQLRRYYQQDPSAWDAPPAAPPDLREGE